LSTSSVNNEPTSHLEATASHDFSIQDNHMVPSALKWSVDKHQAHGLSLAKVTHQTMAKPYIDLHRGEHHRE
jgi:hypothetical protein